MTAEQARALIQERFGVQPSGGASSIVVDLSPERWVEFASFAKMTLDCLYFAYSTAVDWKEEGLEVVCRLENLDENFPVTMKAKLGPGESRCPSLTALYKGAEWMERECYDLFGISFDGHPDLRRILLPQDWEGHPLLKSYAVDTPHAPYR
jgi:NADH-quinone oxidoreductase subunit C